MKSELNSKYETLNPKQIQMTKIDSFAVILSEAKNLVFFGQVLRLCLRMTHKCHFEHLKSEF